MNVKKRLEHLAAALDAGRRLGKTTMQAEACKNLDGIYLCADLHHAKAIKYEHNVHTESIEKNLGGYRGPFFMDHFATSKMFRSAARKIEELEQEICQLKDRVVTTEFDNHALQKEISDLQSTIVNLKKDW